jgi:hypothetical protein
VPAKLFNHTTKNEATKIQSQKLLFKGVLLGEIATVKGMRINLVSSQK